MTVQIITFEDEHVSNLYPVTLGRPAYGVLCGSYRLIDWLERLDRAPRALVRDYLIDLQTAEYPSITPVTDPITKHASSSGTAGVTMWVNARLIPSRQTYRTLRALREKAQPCVVQVNSSVAVALFPATAPPPPAELSVASLGAYFEDCGIQNLKSIDVDLSLAEYPHELIYYNQQTLVDNLEYRLRKGGYREMADGVFVAEEWTQTTSWRVPADVWQLEGVTSPQFYWSVIVAHRQKGEDGAWSWDAWSSESEVRTFTWTRSTAED